MSTGAADKIHVLAIDYRGYGYSSGTPSEEGLIIDGVAAVKWALEVAHIPPERIVLMGQSLGTAVAVAVAERILVDDMIEFKGIILVAAFSDIPTLMSTYAIGGIIPILSPLRPYPFLQQFFANRVQETWFTVRRLANLVWRSKNINLQLIHSKNDFNILWSHSQTLFYAAANATTERGMTSKQIDATTMHEDLGRSGHRKLWKAVSEKGNRKTIKLDVVHYGGRYHFSLTICRKAKAYFDQRPQSTSDLSRSSEGASKYVRAIEFAIDSRL